jgi:hypothetical protein
MAVLADCCERVSARKFPVNSQAALYFLKQDCAKLEKVAKFKVLRGYSLLAITGNYFVRTGNFNSAIKKMPGSFVAF